VNENEPERRWRAVTLAVADGVTSVVLLLVLAALAWMTVADTLPPAWRLPSLEAEVFGVVGLLTVALLAVSGLALLQARHRPG
jgi:hypothetical protein